MVVALVWKLCVDGLLSEMMILEGELGPFYAFRLSLPCRRNVSQRTLWYVQLGGHEA